MVTMFCAPPSTSLSVLLVIILCSLFFVADASIRVVNLGREYKSRPDKYVGLQMKPETEYGARLQRIPGDQHMCGGGHWNATVPDDGRPVALLAKKGMCSFHQKAEFASRNIHPPGIVKVLIIDGEMRIKDDDYDNDNDNDDYKFEHEFNGNTDDYRDENFPISSYEYPPYYNNWNNESSLTLRRRHANDISVVLLHVSYQTGVDLLDLVLNEESDVRDQGGALLSVDGVAPPLNRAVVIIWTAVCVVLSLLACCCLVSLIEDIVGLEESEPEPPRRRRRQRLTFDQVRKIPIGIFDGRQLIYDEEIMIDQESGEDSCQQPNNMFFQPADHSLDACTICLDDYEIGDKLRCLPCKHAFHANCIAKWLVERSATCPLCKIDLYEEEDDGELEQQQQQPQNDTSPTLDTETTEQATATENPGEPWWRNMFRSTEERRQVSESLTEPLLQQEQAENARSEATNDQEISISEESTTAPTSHNEETAGGSTSS